MSNVESPTGIEPVGHQGARVEIVQRPALAVSGWLGVLVLAGSIWAAVEAANHDRGLLWLPILVAVLVITSLVIVTPGQTSVVQFFGRYIGTIRRAGFWWVLPLTVRRSVSVRVRNFETGHLKVNDADGNPVEIAAIVVWQVADTAKSTYAVDRLPRLRIDPGRVRSAPRRDESPLRGHNGIRDLVAGLHRRSR